MENRINIAKLLKDCPKGMELYSPIFGKVYLYGVRPYLAVIVNIGDEHSEIQEEFLYDGRYGLNGECMLFPSKDKTSWEGFVSPYEFKDGDILSYQFEGFKNRTIYIYKQHSRMNTTYYVALSGDYDSEFMINDKEGHALNGYNNSVRLATKEEKDKLFKVIKDNGYKWNAETKTLEKLIEPKFKVGDTIQDKKAKYKVKITEVNTKDRLYGYESLLFNGIGSFSFAEQDNWELVFNAQALLNGHITEILPDVNIFPWNDKKKCLETIKATRFDISSLIPFESRVLVRESDSDWWRPAWYGCKSDINKRFYVLSAGSFQQCIPYAGNEHLNGTQKDCNDFYKTWEE